MPRQPCSIDAFILALTDPGEYDDIFGSGFGAVNRIGVCDCNNDGFCNSFDIDCFEALAEAPVECSDGYEEQECPGDRNGFSGPSQESTWTHFMNRWMRFEVISACNISAG